MAETIVFGGQKLDIDLNDELWKQLVEKYSKKHKKKTGWEPLGITDMGWCIDPTNSTFHGGVNQLLLDSDKGMVGRAHNAVFEDRNFCEMQARAEQLRRYLLDFAAKNESPRTKQDQGFVISYDDALGIFIINELSMDFPIFDPVFATHRCAADAMKKFAEDLLWMVREYKPRLDQEV